MSEFDAAALTAGLLVAKGAAAPSRFAVRKPPSRGKRGDGLSHFSLRLDAMRHRRLRLAAVHLRKSGQALLLAALDHYVDRVVPGLLGERCQCLEDGRRAPETCIALVPQPVP